ncbi:MAG: dTMP kinase [bacterium]|nr:dTMP kinase [bacterium]
MERGLLIVFEGLDGCGKSTQLDLLSSRLRRATVDVVRTREPTDGPVGRRIREMARSGERVPPEQELDWFMEDRREHVREVIEPGLAAGAVVLCDRYWLSTVAYQGARGLDSDAIMRASEAEFPDPDLALLFEIPAAEGLTRVRARGGIAEPAFEELEFLARVEKVFASIDRGWIARIDARRGVDAIHEDVVARVRGVGVLA